ncbi:hypothetical protein N7462_003998 [Penicillium macrosclerotiorum]|uniref:uncharacterized protein n=1 Tax=Penicillium macrosclerotiorum TaxID=303699 RepID=UPI002548D5F2|nr:uncharacterized protein N7462_003998 [Penicillium macrosclerotiorum]KAJ5689606.1 hypothetical protein N7462_003998 [Penicillium macrosclerotiorum]
MASTRLSASFHPRDPITWQHLLRATLRECTYLPDPIARTYMREHVLERYRRSLAARDAGRPEHQLARAARHGLSLLQRANEGYQRPLERVLYMSYGRIGKRRHQLLARISTPQVPKDTNAVEALIAQPIKFEDGWEPTEIVLSLAKSQMNNGIVTSSRLRPALKSLQPVIPDQNSWGRPVCRRRRVNIRRKWFSNMMDSLLPPLPTADLEILDGLIAGTVEWKPRPRARAKSSDICEDLTDSLILSLLTDGPQKGHTFGKHANGRPHEITDRFMRRLWKRISSLVPRMHWVEKAEKWSFSWETPKSLPWLAFEIDVKANLNNLFEDQADAGAPCMTSGKD